MIIRVLRGCVQPDHLAAFREQAQQALLSARSHEGLVHAEFGRQAHADGSAEIVFVSVWRDMAALYDWVGCDLMATPLLACEGDYPFETYDVQHFETLGDAGADEPDDGRRVPVAEGMR